MVYRRYGSLHQEKGTFSINLLAALVGETIIRLCNTNHNVMANFPLAKFSLVKYSWYCILGESAAVLVSCMYMYIHVPAS